MQRKFSVWIALVTAICLLSNCGKRENDAVFTKEQPSQKTTIQKNNIRDELDFEVKNGTKKTVYVACFSYIQKEPNVRWRWDKSPIYKLNPDESVFINVDTIPDQRNREDIFGYLAVFEHEPEAHDAIFELLNDTKKIDLDRLHNLKGKRVILAVEKYGFKPEKLDFSVAKKIKKKHLTPELDFIIENNTGQTIYVTCFVYQIEDNIRSVWHYDKTPVQKLEAGQVSIVNVDTIKEARDRSYMLGYLGIFGEDEEQKAHEATYELLPVKNKITLGNLADLKNKKIVIEIEQYGSVGEIMEFKALPEKPTPPIPPTPPAKQKQNKKTYQLFKQNNRTQP